MARSSIRLSSRTAPFLALSLAATLALPTAAVRAQDTCVGYFGIGATQGNQCKPFPGRKIEIGIDRLPEVLADRHITAIRIVSDDHPDAAFDLSPLAGADHIRSLDIFREGPVDLTPILSMRGLKALSLSIDAATALPQLGNTGPAGVEGLRLYGPRLTLDIATLSGWSALRDLSINAEGVSGTSSLASLTALERLRVSHKTPADYTPLAGLPRLTTLWINGTIFGHALEDITFLETLPQLDQLDLSKNPISDLSPLANLKGLSLLAISDTNVEDLAPLSGLTGLRQLHARKTKVKTLAPLAKLTEMRVLWLDNTPVEDITPLSGMTNLFGLELSRTKVSDLTPLAGLENLRHLSTRGAPVTDYAPVPKGVNLKK